MDESPSILVERLAVQTEAANLSVVHDVSFTVDAGAAHGIVGESGAGKTTIALALLGYARPGMRVSAGRVLLSGVDVLAESDRARRRLRSQRLGYVAQSPATALDPSIRVGRQIGEGLLELGVDRSARAATVRLMLEAVRLPSDRDFQRRYPHELSGGEQQRAAIAGALISRPDVLILDEPTTGLDVVTQHEIVALIRELHACRENTLVYISHNLPLIRSLVHFVTVVYAGEVVETGAANRVFRDPYHPYTRLLIGAVPRLQGALPISGLPGEPPSPGHRPSGCSFAPRCPLADERCSVPPRLEKSGSNAIRCWRWRELRDGVRRDSPHSALGVTSRQSAVDRKRAEAPLMEVINVSASYGSRGLRGRSHRSVLRDVTLRVDRGACTAIVGESGSGKTTLARCILGLHEPDTGTVSIAGVKLSPSLRDRSRAVRQSIQFVFQDPDSSLNPRQTVGEAVGRPLRIYFGLNRLERRTRVEALLGRVRLPRSVIDRFPHELSGGERQRVALARALAASPRVLICDEVTSSLDVVTEASIIDALQEIAQADDMALLFISHDLALVSQIADRTIVLRDGQVVEELGGAGFVNAAHPYTAQLMDATPEFVPGDYLERMTEEIVGGRQCTLT